VEKIVEIRSFRRTGSSADGPAGWYFAMAKGVTALLEAALTVTVA
jgi:hypothetical protein